MKRKLDSFTVNSIGMKFSRVPRMNGGELGEFYVGQFPVTEIEYASVIGRLPRYYFMTPRVDYPVVHVNWLDVINFCKLLTDMDSERCERRVYTPLTTEEWRFCCTDGKTRQYCFGDDIGTLGDFAWYKTNTSELKPIGTRAANDFGLYDMHGNVWEWCIRDPSLAQLVRSLDDAQVCGGSWASTADQCSADSVKNLDPRSRRLNVGFRIKAIVQDVDTYRPSRKLSEIEYNCEKITNSIGMTFVKIPTPLHSDDIDLPSRSYWLGVFPVTRQQVTEVLGIEVGYSYVLSGHDSGRLPAQKVTWDLAMLFCERLSSLEGEQQSGRKYRLPTEVEWIYASRGQKSAKSFSVEELDDQAWTRENCDGLLMPVGLKAPNSFGLYDILGSVSEWCSDETDDTQSNSSESDRNNLVASRQRRIAFGGNWLLDRKFCQGYRIPLHSAHSSSYVGFRVILEEYPVNNPDSED